MSQLAKLHIRGKLVTVTARNLTLQQNLEAQNAADLAFNDPELRRAKTMFCARLGHTIKNEYKDVETALQEVLISFWMTSVDILFHRPKKAIIKIINATCSDCRAVCMVKEMPIKVCACGSTNRFKAPADLIDRTTNEVEDYYRITTGKPAPERDLSILHNPTQRRKFYKTCMWNYLRQIIRENTYPKAISTVKLTDYADNVVFQQVQAALEASLIADEVIIKKEILASSTKKKAIITKPYTIIAPTMLLPADVCQKLHAISVYASSHGVKLTIKDHADGDLGEIIISCDGPAEVVTSDVTTNTRLHQISLDISSDDESDNSFREHIESHSSTAQDKLIVGDSDYCDGAAVVRNRLCVNGQLIFDLIVNPCKEYVERYGANPCKAHIAAFLGISPREVQRQWEIIALQMRAVDLVPKG